MRAKEIITKTNLVEARVRYEGLVLDYSIDGANVDVRAIVDGKQVGYVIFNRDGRTLFPDDLAVDAEYRGRGIAKKMYDWVKSLPQRFEIIRGDQTAMGKRFWDKNRGEHVDVWEEDVAEGGNDDLWHGSKSEHEMLYPQQANDTGGKEESNKNAVYATPSAKVAIAMGLTTPGSDTGMFPNDPQMVLFSGNIRKGQMVYLHKVPKNLFIKHNDREWYSKPGVKEVKPIEIKAVPVDQWLHLIRQATPQDLELQKKYMKKAVKEVVHPDIFDKHISKEPTEKVRMGDFEFDAHPFKGRIRGYGNLNDIGLYVTAYDRQNVIGWAHFVVKSDEKGNQWLESADTQVDDDYVGRGVAAMMYAFAKSLGNDIKPSPDQTNFGKRMWKKWGKDANHLVGEQGVAEDTVDEMALASYKTLGDFSKPGSFRGVDKRLVPHPKSELKAAKFFEQTPYDFRLFFANKPGLGQYQEHGPMTPDQIVKVFGEEDAKKILENHDDAITVVYVSNRGAEKVMMTPWIMAHRFGHAIQAGASKEKWSAWQETEKLFFSTVNRLLDEYYGKMYRGPNTYSSEIKWDMAPEYNALFNAIGTQKSSRTGQIRRPYEFMYELFAQYLGTGTITLNPLPTNLSYGRKVFGNPSKYLNIKPEFRDETERRQISEMLARDMELMFNDVLGNSVGQVYVM